MNTFLINSNINYKINSKINELLDNVENIIYYNLNESSIMDVLTEASYFSMFEDKKVIVVKNCKFFGTQKSDSDKESIDKILKYLENENSNTRIIFIYDGKCDSRKKLYNLLKDNNNVFTYFYNTKTELKNELKEYVINNKFDCRDNFLWYLIDKCNSNYDICINELNKIFIYYDNPCEIKLEEINNLISNTINDNNFKIVDSIINKDFDNIYSLLNDFNKLKQDPMIIINLLYREFKLMLSYLELNNKYSYNELLKELGIQGWQLEKLKKETYLYNINEIKDEIIKLSLLDYKYKCGIINKDTLLIEYIISQE